MTASRFKTDEADTINALIRDVAALQRQLRSPGPSFFMRLENDVASAFTNNTTVKVPMDTVVYESISGICDLSNDWATIPDGADGWWAFEGGALQTAVFTTGAITYQTTLSGASGTGGAAPIFDTYFPPVSSRKVLKGVCLARCAAGDHVFIQIFQNSGATLTADGTPTADFNFLRGVRLCA